MSRILDQPADADFIDFYERLTTLLELTGDAHGYSHEREGGGRAGIAVLDEGILSFSWRTGSLGEATLVPWPDVEGVHVAMDLQDRRGIVYRLSIDNPETMLTDSNEALRDVIRATFAMRRIK